MIIIEGMDNTGKTTLGEKLASHFGVKLEHSIKPENADEAILTCSKLLNGRTSEICPEGGVRILDRCTQVAELVYGHTLRGGSLCGEQSWDWIRIICSFTPLFIYCRPQEDLIFKWGDREQMEGVINHRKALLKRYDYVMGQIKTFQDTFGGIFLQYDYDKDRLDLYQEGKVMEITTVNPTIEVLINDIYLRPLSKPEIPGNYLVRALTLVDQDELKNG